MFDVCSFSIKIFDFYLLLNFETVPIVFLQDSLTGKNMDSQPSLLYFQFEDSNIKVRCSP